MSKKQELFNGGWMLLIIFCTFVCVMTIVFYPYEMNDYQEECVQSHVETKQVYIGQCPSYGHQGLCSFTTNPDEAKLKTPVSSFTKTICDKYALVRNAEGEGK